LLPILPVFETSRVIHSSKKQAPPFRLFDFHRFLPLPQGDLGKVLPGRDFALKATPAGIIGERKKQVSRPLGTVPAAFA
jgi:hypothetical protein